VKSFACESVVPGCPARFRGDDEDAILAQVAVHAQRDHGVNAVPAELVERVRAQIVPVTA
jgi:predicted small metal-binding protein